MCVCTCVLHAAARKQHQRQLQIVSPEHPHEIFSCVTSLDDQANALGLVGRSHAHSVTTPGLVRCFDVASGVPVGGCAAACPPPPVEVADVPPVCVWVRVCACVYVRHRQVSTSSAAWARTRERASGCACTCACTVQTPADAVDAHAHAHARARALVHARRRACSSGAPRTSVSIALSSR